MSKTEKHYAERVYTCAVELRMLLKMAIQLNAEDDVTDLGEAERLTLRTARRYVKDAARGEHLEKREN